MNEDFKQRFSTQMQIIPEEKAINKIVAENLKDIMESYNISPYDLADLCHVSVSAVYKWLRGENTPKMVVIYPLCNTLKVPLNAFMNDHGVIRYVTTHRETAGFEINDEERKLVRMYRHMEPQRKSLYFNLASELTDMKAVKREEAKESRKKG